MLIDFIFTLFQKMNSQVTNTAKIAAMSSFKATDVWVPEIFLNLIVFIGVGQILNCGAVPAS